MIRYPVATKTLQPLSAKKNGAATTAYETCIVREGVPVTDSGPWTAAVTLDGQTGAMIDHLPRGRWSIYGRLTANPEVPIILFCTIETF